MRRRHLGFGQQIHRGLEFFAMVEFRDYPEKIERPPQERGIGIKAGQPDIPQRLQPDLVEGGRQIIGASSGAELAKAIGKSESEFALAAERGDCIAHFLDLGQPVLVIADPGDHPLDARIVAGSLDRIEKISQGRLVADKEPQQRFLAGAFGQLACQIRRQEDVAG